ncbi:protein arginine methyltransferase [Echinococcus multilocularis]|uniref:Protein arginine methyltransferase n=1 Tax=Echinococcus multilocularis TaxID=6211 RepID=A0A0S4MJ96_ECHMU|nr:protein arginine methyltransferase [Echinococcus multilocularis]
MPISCRASIFIAASSVAPGNGDSNGYDGEGEREEKWEEECPIKCAKQWEQLSELYEVSKQLFYFASIRRVQSPPLFYLVRGDDSPRGRIGNTHRELTSASSVSMLRTADWEAGSDEEMEREVVKVEDEGETDGEDETKQ